MASRSPKRKLKMFDNAPNFGLFDFETKKKLNKVRSEGSEVIAEIVVSLSSTRSYMRDSSF